MAKQDLVLSPTQNMLLPSLPITMIRAPSIHSAGSIQVLKSLEVVFVYFSHRLHPNRQACLTTPLYLQSYHPQSSHL